MNHLSIGKRLALGFSVLILMALLSTLLALWRLHDAASLTEAMMREPLAKERLVSDLYRNVQTGLRRTTAIIKSSDPSLAAFFAADTAATTQQSNEYQKTFEPLLRNDDEKKLFAEVASQRKLYIAARDRIVKLKHDGDAEQAAKLFDAEFLPIAKGYTDRMASLLALERRAIDTMAAQIDDLNTSSRNGQIGLGVLLLLLGVTTAWWVTRSIARPLSDALGVAQRIAQGDLSPTRAAQAAGRDEIALLLQALESMRGALARTIRDIRSASESIRNASVEIAHGNQDLSGRTEQTASSLQQTAASMDQLTGSVRQSADAAQQANQLASSATQVAQRGGQVVSAVVSTMEGISAASSRIADIIGVIDGIAFQTNILALNAAVEAARAGEQGRGFAVVASEVRSLAQRSAGAAREIKSLIGSSAGQVENGTRLVTDAGATMNELLSSVQRVTDIVAEICAAATEQASGIGLVNTAVNELDAMTQQNSALVEQSAAASESLKQQAARLNEMVSLFRLEGAGA